MSIDIIVVDDHSLVRAGIVSLLQKQDDFNVVGEAGSGLDALRLIEEKESVDVVVLDVEMEGLDGIETAQLILDMKPGIKVLALSMHEEQDYVVAMLTHGAQGYILKDAALEELVSAIRVVQGGQRYLSNELVGVVLESLESGGVAYKKPAFSELTPRELEVLTLIACGKTSKEMANELHLSVKTIDAHRQSLMKKLEIFTVAELTRFAIREGLLEA